MELLRLENGHLREKLKNLKGAEERAKAIVAEYIYYNNLEKIELQNRIKFLKEQITQLTNEVQLYKKKDSNSDSGEQNIEMDPEGGEIKAGTLEKLIECLYATKEGYQSTEYATVFLLTYRSYTNPKEVLEHLIAGYTKLVGDSNNPDVTSRLRIGNFLKKWVSDSFHDFSDQSLLDRYQHFVNSIISEHQKSLASSILQTLDTKTKGGSKRVSGAMFSVNAPQPLVPRAITSIVDINPLEVARQLTLVDYNLCKAIEPKECLGCAWTKHDKETRSPNLLSMIKRFNKVSRWAAASIVQEPNLKKRVRILSHFISILQHLKELNNFNAIFQIIGGLGNSSVHRITKTFQQIDARQRKILEDMKVLTDPLKSWANYRRAIREIDPPCVPFIGVYQTDLTFIEDGNPTKFANGMINFKKCRLVASVIQEIITYQQKPYNLSSAQTVQDFLEASIEQAQSLDDKKLYDLSLVAEPRANAK